MTLYEFVAQLLIYSTLIFYGPFNSYVMVEAWTIVLIIVPPIALFSEYFLKYKWIKLQK